MEMNKYIFRLASSMRRKKSPVLIIAFALILIIFGLHYNRNVETIGGQILPNLLQGTVHPDKVNFLINNESSNIEKTNDYLQDKYEKILSRDEIFPNGLNSVDNIVQIDTEQQLGIPVVNSYNKHPYIPGKRLVHLDLKGAPPLVSYYRRFFPFIKNLGATGILIEYEDMFPYDGVLRNLSAKNSYSKLQVAEILNLAEESNLEVIPLIQTFGHLEFALKLEEFLYLREVPNSPQALCPKRNGSLQFIEEMVNQVTGLCEISVIFLSFSSSYCPVCYFPCFIFMWQNVLSLVLRRAHFIT